MKKVYFMLKDSIFVEQQESVFNLYKDFLFIQKSWHCYLARLVLNKNLGLRIRKLVHS